MTHGFANLVYDHQGSRRGDTRTFSENMLMGMASRDLGPGRLGLRAMISAEPWTIGREGYPLLLQTGETANGVTPLVDRQHPHDLPMELAATYSVPVGQGTDSSVFVYAGLPGEPALGPATFMHRFSGMDNPEAPLGHHWLDSTHVTFGVATLGWIRGNVKVEGSVFTGREPDQNRTDIESPKMDSWSARISWQPARDWSLQVSHGHLNSPEQLEPEVDADRTTASAMYNRPLADGDWQTTLRLGAERPPSGDDHRLLAPRIGGHPRAAHPLRAGGAAGERRAARPRRGSRLYREQALPRLHLRLLPSGQREVGRGGAGEPGPDSGRPPRELYGADRPLSWMGFLRVRI